MAGRIASVGDLWHELAAARTRTKKR